MEDRIFAVGDKVVEGENIGTVTKITPKRGIITVDYGNYVLRYRRHGFRGDDVWSMRYIRKLTPEIEKEIYGKRIISKCRDLLEKTKITVEQAEAILKILED